MASPFVDSRFRNTQSEVVYDVCRCKMLIAAEWRHLWNADNWRLTDALKATRVRNNKLMTLLLLLLLRMVRP